MLSSFSPLFLSTQELMTSWVGSGRERRLHYFQGSLGMNIEIVESWCYWAYFLPDCLCARQLGQRGIGCIQVQLDGTPADVCIRLAGFRRSHQPGRMGLRRRVLSAMEGKIGSFLRYVRASGCFVSLVIVMKWQWNGINLLLRTFYNYLLSSHVSQTKWSSLSHSGLAFTMVKSFFSSIVKLEVTLGHKNRASSCYHDFISNSMH